MFVQIFIDQLSTMTSRPILRPNSLRPATTPHSICSLLRTASQDTPHKRGLSPVLTTIVRFGTLSQITCKNSSSSDDAGQGDILIPFQLRLFTSLLTSSHSSGLLKIYQLPTYQERISCSSTTSIKTCTII